MSILLMAASGLMSVPEATSFDYPQEALRNDRSGAAVIAMMVDPKGKVVRCEIRQEFGDKALSSRICDLQQRHKPARDENGDPAFGMINAIVKYWLPGSEAGDQIARMVDAPNVTLSVADLPTEAEGKIDTKVIVRVDEAGLVAACQPEAEEDIEKPYAAVACSQFSGLSLGVQNGRDDVPVSYVRDLRVRFEQAG